MIYYHGTSTIFNIHRVILPPAITGNLREDWRKANLNQVYVTDSLLSAQKFAYKCADKYGGSPIVYKVKPIGNLWRRKDTEYLADKALILGVHKEEQP